ncbi:hypothetical protein [Nonomuraea sp. NPDC050643]|uniref:YdeI/OmpD-associated family protein n=1 Tax=Nonomuraea sp. NPDC050643 TaxID=3155660 RepID=UPI0033F2AA78
MTTMTILADAAAWRSWLSEHHDRANEAWLVLAKKGTTEPTTLTYEQALEEALCQGWIDGLARSRDEGTYLQRFSPRRPRSAWSRRNVARVERLTRAGRMRPAGLAQVERAQADGRWDAAWRPPVSGPRSPGPGAGGETPVRPERGLNISGREMSVSGSVITP